MAGARVVFNHFARIARQTHESVEEAVADTARAILDDATATIRRQSTDTGALADSGRVDVDGSEAIAGFDDFKAIWVEYGTGAPGPTRAEPFITPAAETHRREFEGRIGRAMERVR